MFCFLKNKVISRPYIAHRFRGFTLVEISMVLSIAALVIAGVMMFYITSSREQKIKESMEELAAIQQAIRTMYSGQSNYDGLTRQTVAESKYLPAKWANPGTGVIKHPFNSYVDISVVTALSSGVFSIQFDDIPDAACIKMVTYDLGKSLVNLYVTGSNITSPGFPGRSMTPSEAMQYCSNSNHNYISWWFN